MILCARNTSTERNANHAEITCRRFVSTVKITRMYDYQTWQTRYVLFSWLCISDVDWLGRQTNNNSRTVTWIVQWKWLYWHRIAFFFLASVYKIAFCWSLFNCSLFMTTDYLIFLMRILVLRWFTASGSSTADQQGLGRRRELFSLPSSSGSTSLRQCCYY